MVTDSIETDEHTQRRSHGNSSTGLAVFQLAARGRPLKDWLQPRCLRVAPGGLQHSPRDCLGSDCALPSKGAQRPPSLSTQRLLMELWLSSGPAVCAQ